MQSLGSAQTQEKKITLKASTLSMAVMVLVFLVAVVFAANQNDVIGWLVVIVSLGWLLLSSFLVFGLRRGAKRVETQLKNATAGMAARAGGPSQTVLVDEATRNRDLKLDHSFKIVQVQVGVITDNLSKPGEEPRQMVSRALETIEITAHNAREMMKPGKGASQPVDGEIID